jgi:hypothetical protein
MPATAGTIFIPTINVCSATKNPRIIIGVWVPGVGNYENFPRLVANTIIVAKTFFIDGL